jgi:hypothetical protein
VDEAVPAHSTGVDTSTPNTSPTPKEQLIGILMKQPKKTKTDDTGWRFRQLARAAVDYWYKNGQYKKIIPFVLFYVNI